MSVKKVIHISIMIKMAFLLGPRPIKLPDKASKIMAWQNITRAFGTFLTNSSPYTFSAPHPNYLPPNKIKNKFYSLCRL